MDVLIDLINLVTTVLTVLIIARALLSWVNPSPSNPIVRVVYRTTEPILGPIQSILPAPGGIDFSPLVALILIQFIGRQLINLIYNLS